MNTCPSCNFQNPEEIRICLRCAASLNLHCVNCGAELPAGNLFCGQCGTPVEPKASETVATQSEPLTAVTSSSLLAGLRAKMPANLATKITLRSTELVGQRKEVTVFIVEIANYKQALQALDSETTYLALDEIMRLLADIIYKYEGTIDQFTGSGVMALFGIPLNHENDPERAVRAALEIQSLFAQIQARLRQAYHFDFQISIGVNTGTIIAGRMDLQNYLEYTVVGDTVKLAANLMALCPAGSILVSFSTYQRTHPVINYHRIPPDLATGPTAPLQIFQPLDIHQEPGQLRGLPGLQVPMVGRREDFRLLNKAIKQVGSQNNSHIVLVSGEAGIGKTRLITECRIAFGEQSFRFFQGTCAAYMRCHALSCDRGYFTELVGNFRVGFGSYST